MTKTFTLRTLGLATAVVLAAGSVWYVGRGPERAPSASLGAALVCSVRSEPRTFNRYVARDTTSVLVSELTQAKLVRINRDDDQVEPWLAEGWTEDADGLTYTLTLRDAVTFSDGAPFTSADVLFAFEAVYDERVGSPLADALRVGGRPLEVSAPDARTVVVRFPAPFSPGLRLLDNLPILPKDRLGEALAQGTLRDAWGLATPPEEITGLGPFVLEEYLAGQRLVFARNPRYWRRDEDGAVLPYLDRLTVEIVRDQNAEILRLETGQIDFTTTPVRAEDYARLNRAARDGELQLFDLGVGLDSDFLWFNLQPEAKADDPRRTWLQSDELRRAISQAVDRQVFADTVYLGLADPVYGPVTPGNRTWFAHDVPKHRYDPARARALLAGLGLEDSDQDGILEDAADAPVRFSLLTQRGSTARERAAAVLQEDLRQVGILADVVPLEFGALIDRITRGDYDAAYFGFVASDTDPAVNLDFWLSRAAFHIWNPGQAVPATAWERQIDELMRQQIAAEDPLERKRLFDEVQSVLARYVPVIHFAAPRVFIAASTRVANVRPALLEPHLLWNADELAVGSSTE